LNRVPRRGRWISFRVLSEQGRDALGAELSFSLGERRLTRTVKAAYSYLASNDPRVHVGLGEATGVSDVRVLWLDGKAERFGDFEAESLVVLRRGEGRKLRSAEESNALEPGPERARGPRGLPAALRRK
jgi:hypothetical protein